jgi:hypothetical protein
MLWLRRDLFTIPPDLLTLEKAMVGCGIASSLTSARRLIREGAVYLNNEKLTCPGDDFTGVFIGNGELIRDA